jgi:molybdenum cofactor cytidylyltransferase
MKFEPVPLSAAKGMIMGHNVAGADGRRLVRKGKPLSEDDLDALRALGRTSVYIALLEEDDVDENTAARRVAEAVCGPGLSIAGGSVGRTNLLSNKAGLLRVDVDRLTELNECNGITLATLRNHSPVRERQIVATIKIIPYAVPVSILSRVEAIADEGPGKLRRDGGRPIVRVDALPPHPVGMILSGSKSIQQKLVTDFSPLRKRVENLGSSVTRTDFVALDDEADEVALADVLGQQLASGIRLILLAGETAIMDEDDIVPRAVGRVGGHVESTGAPVDPGNLLMLAYIGDVPVVGAPGCARSKKINIVDWILPRLLAGDRLTRRDIVELGHGGLLQDVPERGMPRDMKETVSQKEVDPEPSSATVSTSG